MHYSALKLNDIANGPGVRVSLFVSGCRLRCPGCFNEAAWDFSAGSAYTQETQETICKALRDPWRQGLTILGGEPFEPAHQETLCKLVETVRDTFGSSKSIWMYTGCTFEALMGGYGYGLGEITECIIENLDVLVDGPFQQDAYEMTLAFRGSSNQRLIDVPKSLSLYPPKACLLDESTLFRAHRGSV